MDGRIYRGRIEEPERFARALEPTIDRERTPDRPPFLFDFSRGVGSSVGAAACSRWVCVLPINDNSICNDTSWLLKSKVTATDDVCTL